MKNRLKKWNQFFHKYINGMKGVISLYLVITMLPITSLALVVVESARLQSAVEVLEEFVDSLGLSTLADYDSYQEQRFGLLAMAQKGTPGDTFKSYLDANSGFAGNSFTINSTNVDGKYALSEEEVFKKQILEVASVSSATELFLNGIDIEGILKYVKEQLGLKQFDKLMKSANSIGKSVNDVASALEAIEKLLAHQKEYKKAQDSYSKAYTEFQTEVLNVAKELKEAKEKDQDDAGTEPVDYYADTKVAAAIKKALKKRDNYVTKLEALSTEADTFTSALNSFISSATKISEDFYKGSSGVDDFLGEKNVEYTKSQIAGAISKFIENSIGKDFTSKAAKVKEALSLQKTQLKKFKGEDVEDNWTSNTVYKLYGPLNSNLVLSSDFGKSIEDFKKDCSNSTESQKDEPWYKQITKTLDALRELTRLSGFADSRLCAKIPSSSLYVSVREEWYGTTSTHALMDFLSAINDVMDAIKKFAKGSFSGFVKLLKGIGEFFLAMGEFLATILAFIATVATRVGHVVGNVKDLGNELLLTAYCAYNLPSRTTYQSGKALTGYSYMKIYQMADGPAHRQDITNIIDMFISGRLPVDKADLFRGAELEYIAEGTDNELGNQFGVFMGLFMLRMLLDLPSVLNNPFVTAMRGAADAVLCGAVVLVIFMILEPLLDALLIVNGGEVPLIKADHGLYSSPTGITGYLGELLKKTQIGSANADKLKKLAESDMSEADKKLSVKGAPNWSYAEYVTFLILFTVNEDRLVKRLQNISYMEAKKKNEASIPDYSLDKAYTMLNVTLDANLNPMLKLDGLGSNGLFHIKRNSYHGY